MLPAGSVWGRGEVAEEVELEVKMRGPEPVRRWPGRAAPRGGQSEGSGISPEWLRREAKAGARETEPEEPEEELGVWCFEEECGRGETGERRPGGSVSGLSLEERSTAAAKASESVSGIGGGWCWRLDMAPAERKVRWISGGRGANAAWNGGEMGMGIS
jgi:hypothetical protein